MTTIDYSEILKALEHASLFDLYRLSVSMHHRMEDPEELFKIRQSIHEGEIISYFDGHNNALQKAKILQKNPKYLVVQSLENNKRWKLPYYMINLESKNIDIPPQHKVLKKEDFKVGECAGFQSEKGQIIGVIVRRNQKTATLITRDNSKWRVSYLFLFKVVDAELSTLFFTKPELFLTQ